MDTRFLAAIASVFLVASVGRPLLAIAEDGERPVTLDLEKARLSAVLKSIHLQTQGSFNIVVQSEVAERIGPQVKVEGVPASRTLAIVAAAYGLCLKLGDEQIVKLLECPESDIAPATDVFEYWWTPPPPCVEDHTAT